MKAREKRRRTERSGRLERIIRSVSRKEGGISEVIGTILILGLVVIVMSTAFVLVQSRLPNATPTSASVSGLNVTFHPGSGPSVGYIAGSFVYMSGPSLNVENFNFLLLLDGGSHYYSISNFTSYPGNSWNMITPGTTVLFNTSAMRDENGQLANNIPQSSNYTMDILDKGTILWSWSSASTVFYDQPVIAYSWWVLKTKFSISLLAAVYGNVDTITGDFSAIYGANNYSAQPLSPTSSFDVYRTTLPLPHKTAYYEIIVTSGSYTITEWFQMKNVSLSKVLGQTYNVTFQQPLVTGYNVTVDITGPTGAIGSGPIPSGSSYWVYLPNGTYNYTATSGKATDSGTFTVAGTSVTIDLYFKNPSVPLLASKSNYTTAKGSPSIQFERGLVFSSILRETLSCVPHSVQTAETASVLNGNAHIVEIR